MIGLYYTHAFASDLFIPYDLLILKKQIHDMIHVCLIYNTVAFV